jgi:uncharacterized protein
VTVLLDVNVLVALAWPNHTHHAAARRWFRSERSSGWATCPLTQSGFITVSSNPRFTPEAKSPQEAALLLRHMIMLPGHVFWNDDISLLEEKWLPIRRIVTHQQVSDAHILAVALRHGGRLATFDRAIARLVPENLDPGSLLQLITWDSQ